MAWLLDAGVLLRAADAGRLSELVQVATARSLVLAEEVYDEVARPRSRRPRVIAAAKAAKELIDESAVVVRSIPLASPASSVFQALRAGRSTANDAGECASVALALHDRDYIFVTGEKGAAVLGVHQLGERVMTIPWFLRALVDGGALDKQVARDIQAEDRMAAPVWWEDWAGVP